MPSSTPEDPTKYCCVYIPVRHVLLVATVFAMLVSGVLGALGILALDKINTQLSDLQRLAILFHILIHLLFAFCCLLGIYASAMKNVTCTSVFIAVIIGQMMFSLASGALCIYILFDSAQAWNASKCLTIAFDPFTRNLCQRTPVFKGLTIGFLSVLWIVDIVAVIVGTSFSSQLREETMQLELVEPKYGPNGFYV